MKTSRDFEELLAYFNARGVEYLVVGAHAFAFHGKPRFTKDLELLVRRSPENARRILSASMNSASAASASRKRTFWGRSRSSSSASFRTGST